MNFSLVNMHTHQTVYKIWPTMPTKKNTFLWFKNEENKMLLQRFACAKLFNNVKWNLTQQLHLHSCFKMHRRKAKKGILHLCVCSLENKVLNANRHNVLLNINSLDQFDLYMNAHCTHIHCNYPDDISLYLCLLECKCECIETFYYFALILQ